MKTWFDAEVAKGLGFGLLGGVALLAVVLPARSLFHAHASKPPASARPVAVAAAPAGPIERRLELAGEPTSRAAERLAQWVVGSADNGNLAFAILDKRNAKVYVFEPGGRLRGASPVLLGYAAGDDSVAGIGKKAIADVRPQERTTPAGRFVAKPGRNANQEDVVWVDYEAAVSMHRVRLNNPAERRAERLASKTAADNRISYGCINMPPAFFEQTLWPSFRQRGGIVYVLPEVKTLAQVFPALGGSGSAAPTRVAATPARRRS
jgi:hypothetical protein